MLYILVIQGDLGKDRDLGSESLMNSYHTASTPSSLFELDRKIQMANPIGKPKHDFRHETDHAQEARDGACGAWSQSEFR